MSDPAEEMTVKAVARMGSSRAIRLITSCEARVISRRYASAPESMRTETV